MSHTYPKVGYDVINLLKLWAVTVKSCLPAYLYEIGPGYGMLSSMLAISRLSFVTDRLRALAATWW